LANRIVTIERKAHREAYAQGHGEAMRLARQESRLIVDLETAAEEALVVDESELMQTNGKASTK
jgi:hypothetical protein